MLFALAADVDTATIRNWWGGLVDGMRDASGQMYMRNRYYDPASGQFTQPDPIGLAGGLNAYGFAAGDPVSYSDPYGLNPCLSLGKAAACAGAAAASDLTLPVGDAVGALCLAAAVATVVIGAATVADVAEATMERRREPEIQTYWRKAGPVETQDVVSSGEVWGGPMRNIFQSDIPKVKAVKGTLPAGVPGYEFTTVVPPDHNGNDKHPWATWSGTRPDIQVQDTPNGDMAKIPVTVTKVQP